jgi:hypothetical protein
LLWLIDPIPQIQSSVGFRNFQADAKDFSNPDFQSMPTHAGVALGSGSPG